MLEYNVTARRRALFSLPVRITIGLVAAAIIPLAIIFSYVYLVTRPALIDQANQALSNDAKTKVQLIDTYFHERTLDIQTITQVPVVQEFLVLPPDNPQYQTLLVQVNYSLSAGIFRDKNYSNWSLFNAQGKLLDTAPLNSMPSKHGSSYFTADQIHMVLTGKTFISPVYYNPQTQKASVDFYSPVVSPIPQQKAVVGFVRTTLDLNYIYQNIIANDNGVGQGYAFIVDNNGVRIADSDPARRFTSVMPLSTSAQQQINTQQRYGTGEPVPVIKDAGVTNALNKNAATSTFNEQPAGQNQAYQIAQQKVSSLPWNYFVLSPASTITQVASNQLFYMAIVGLCLILLATIVGILVGRRLARPITQAVLYLRENSRSLSTLATNQQEAATEQVWVVDSSQIGLQSVQYYTNATKIATNELRQLATDVSQNWRQANAQQVEELLKRFMKIIRYIEEATNFQDASNQKLSTALKVATQVTDQLQKGATSATEAATQLEQVVQDLQAVVGR